MAGGIKDGIWAVSDGMYWFWLFGRPESLAVNCKCTEMKYSEDGDFAECYVDGSRLVVTGQEMIQTTVIADRFQPMPPPEGGDKPFIGFDNLPEPEFGTGWDDFDWSK